MTRSQRRAHLLLWLVLAPLVLGAVGYALADRATKPPAGAVAE